MKKALLEEKAKLGHDMRAMHKLAADEKRGFTSDETEKWHKMTARINAIDAEIARIDQLDDLDAQLRNAPVNNLPKADYKPEDEPTDEQRYAKSFGRLIRSTESGLSGLDVDDRKIVQARMLSQQELRALTTGTGSSGGYTVPEGFGDRVIEAMKQFGGIANVATELPTASGNDLPFPANDDTSNVGAIIGENTANDEQDLAFTQKVLGAYMYTSKIVRVPFQLMQDTAIDLEGFLARKLGERIGRASAAHFATGTGTGQPQGVTVGAGAGATAAAAAAIAFNDLVELEHSVDPAYRQFGGRFVFNDTTLKLLQKTVDGESRPLWLPGVGGAVPPSIYGYPYTIDQGMPNVGASAKSVAFGLMSEYYVRRVQGIQMLRLVERYAEYFQVGFIAYARMDGAVMNSGAIKVLTHPAS